MRLVEELKEIGDEPIIAVLSGNGRTELRVLTSLAQRFDGSRKILFFPRLPIHPKPGSGLQSLKAVKTYLNYKITHTLFLIDREHLERDISETIENTLRSFGIDVQSTQLFPSLRENALLIDGLVGHHEVIIYAAILGRKKSIEECIAKLIELELRRKVKPEKRAIGMALRNHGTSIDTLLTKAQRKSLMTAFPSLSFVLKKIEENNLR